MADLVLNYAGTPGVADMGGSMRGRKSPARATIFLREKLHLNAQWDDRNQKFRKIA